METINNIAEMQTKALDLKRKGLRIGFVPTMGSLHEGHLSLIRLAQQHADRVVVSIFVNPTQFAPHEDFNTYPRSLAKDIRLCENEGADIVFHPSAGEMYPTGTSILLDEQTLSQRLCGTSRPGHFQGVLTVVLKLFNIVRPDIAIFGQKDAQQLRLIQQMVTDLNIPTHIVSAPIIREANGLAMSSRNAYLTPEERKNALSLFGALNKTRQLFDDGERVACVLLENIRTLLGETPSVRIEYIELVDWHTLSPVEHINQPTLVAIAVYIGKTRLIDNIMLGEQS